MDSKSPHLSLLKSQIRTLSTMSSAPSPASVFHRLAGLFTVTDKAFEVDPSVWKLVAAGLRAFSSSQFCLNGDSIQVTLFSASFKRCASLWILLFSDCDHAGVEVHGSCSARRFQSKLQYCQDLLINTFNISSRTVKLLMVQDNIGSLTFALEFSIAILQGMD